MSEKVLLYGGAFNPPTKAHQQITQAGADYACEIGAELWLMPSGDRWDKKIQKPIEQRLAYAHGLLASLYTTASTKVCDYELKLDRPTQTIDTHRYLQSAYPDTEFSWIFGSDSIRSMHTWNMGSLLLSELAMVVVQRPEHEIELEDNMVGLEVDALKISSTQVRALLAAGKPVNHLVPSTILPLI